MPSGVFPRAKPSRYCPNHRILQGITFTPYPGFTKRIKSKEKATRICRRENEYQGRLCRVLALETIHKDGSHSVLGYCAMTPKDRHFQKLSEIGDERWGVKK